MLISFISELNKFNNAALNMMPFCKQTVFVVVLFSLETFDAQRTKNALKQDADNAGPDQPAH